MSPTQQQDLEAWMARGEQIVSEGRLFWLFRLGYWWADRPWRRDDLPGHLINKMHQQPQQEKP